MKQSLVVILLLCLCASLSIAQKKSDQTWAALADRQPKSNSHATENTADSYLAELYAKSYNGKQVSIVDFDQTFYDQVSNPYPYIYALWFNDAVLGQYGKKQYAHQARLIAKMLRDPKVHGTILAAAHYQKGMHYLFSSKFDSARQEFAQVGNLRNWQYVGPFENISQSGFYKNYGPLEHADGKTTFTSSSNAKVKWFAPAQENTDGWNPVCFHFNKTTAVVYAQTFVNSPKEQEVFCNAGAGGAIKVWINDALILSEYTERVTEMDTYTAKCKLQKGINRVLVQLSFTNAHYANFSVRLTDKDHRPLPDLVGSNVYKPYAKAAALKPVPVKHFAESFFEEKISQEPNNIVNYLLLADVYLRNTKLKEARQLIEPALQKDPGNNLLRLKLIEILIKEDNRSVLLEEIAKLRQQDPKAKVILELDIQDALNNQRIDQAIEKLSESESLFGEDLNTIAYRLNFLFREKNYNEFISLAEEAYKRYPNSPVIVKIMYFIRKDVHRDPQGALKVYEDFLNANYNWEIDRNYIKVLQESGQPDKSLQRRRFVAENFPHDPIFLSEIANVHFTAKEYTLASEHVKKALERSPYNENYWEQLGDIESNQNKTAAAMEAYSKSLLYDPNQYGVINKLRKLKGKSESYQLVPPINVDEIIKNDDPASGVTHAGGYYVLHDERSVIMHPGGALEEYDTYIVRVMNENGIDEFKETRIDYSSSQTLLIEKSDVVKRSGTKIKGEINENLIVFPNLEPGDVVVIQYRIQNYSYGRFRNDFWHKQFFGTSVYVGVTRLNVLVPATQKINYVLSNATLKSGVKDVEDFKMYTWETSKQAPIKEEPLMPAWVDIAPVLHLSTLQKWSDIANWYADMINNISEESYELKSVFNQLFTENELKTLTQFAKANRIYTYIQKNIRYSSVPFRQRSYLPQRAHITLATRLGDCKDLSNLFMTLCRMAGVEARMVLVNTQNNGAKDMVLPSLEFNHCIAKASLDGKEYFIELTDNYLPFTSLPNNLINASILEIPQKSGTSDVELKPLVSLTRPKDMIKSRIVLIPDGSDLSVEVTSAKFGAPSSQVRSTYTNLTYDKQFDKLESNCASNYKNVVMDTLAFTNLAEVEDSITMRYKFKLKDEVAEIGALRSFKLPFIDVVATLNKFTPATRVYPIDYNEYEDTDVYQTSISVAIPKGKKLVELPSNENFSFGKMNYSLTYTLTSTGNLEVVRKFTSDRNEIPAKDYAAFRAFIEKIVKVEQRMIAFQ